MGLLRRLGGVADLVVPSWCAGCGMPGDALCERCLAAIPRVSVTGCRRCGHPWSVPTPTCAECPASVARLRFAAAYRDPLPTVFAAYKDGHRRRLSVQLANLVVERCGEPLRGVPLVPVPSSSTRLRSRGFDPAERIAARLGREWQRDVRPLLVRRRDDGPQRGRSATDRASNVRGAFAPNGDAAFPPEVCLVDDVCTTGATLSACARTLRAAGVRRVEAVAVARVLATV